MLIRKLSPIFSVVALIASVVGIVCFFVGFKSITIICGIITIVDSLIQVFYGDQNNLSTEILTVFVGLIISLIIKQPIFQIITLALCIVSAVFTVFGWIAMLISFFTFYKK